MHYDSRKTDYLSAATKNKHFRKIKNWKMLTYNMKWETQDKSCKHRGFSQSLVMELPGLPKVLQAPGSVFWRGWALVLRQSQGTGGERLKPVVQDECPKMCRSGMQIISAETHQSPEGSGRNFDFMPYCLKEFQQKTWSYQHKITLF